MFKKFFTAVLLLGAASVSTDAQTVFNNESNHIYLGVRAGLDVSSASDGYGVYTNGAGFHVGAVYHIPLVMNLYFQPGLNFFYDTFGLTSPVDPIPGFSAADGSIGNAGFRVPFDFGFHFDLTDDINVFVFTGPQLNYSFLARSHWKLAEMKNSSMFGDNGFKHFDLQGRFGAGFTYGRYNLSISGAPGITKVYKSGNVDFRRNLFELSLGYNF